MAEKRSVDQLIRDLQGVGDRWHRLKACTELSELGDPRAVEPLIQRLGDREWVVRVFACLVLASLRDARAVEALIQRLGDSRDWVREAACQALGQLGDARAVESLIQRLGDWKSKVREAGCQALVSIGTASVDPLIQRLGDEDSDVRKAVYEALILLYEQVEPRLRQPLCRKHLTRFERKSIKVKGMGAFHFVCCRACGKVMDAIADVKEIVGVLDVAMCDELVFTDGVVRFNTLKRNDLFDLDRVEIVNASDHEVEHFCIQVGNDTDPFRKPRYKKMTCTVALQCSLSENTLRILRSMFGKVSVDGE